MRYVIAALFAAFAATAHAGGLPPVLSAYDGKLVYLDFWASWCTPCAQSVPWLNAMKKRYGDRLEIVGVNVDAREADMQRFLLRHPVDFPILRDPEGGLAAHYAIDGMPSALIVDRSGRVLHRHSGFRGAEVKEYEAAIRTAIAADSKGN